MHPVNKGSCLRRLPPPPPQQQTHWKDLGSFSSTTNSEQFKSNQCRLSQPFCQWLEPSSEYAWQLTVSLECAVVWVQCMYLSTHKQTNKQTNKQTSKQTNKQTTKQARKQANQPTNKQKENKPYWYNGLPTPHPLTEFVGTLAIVDLDLVCQLHLASWNIG